MKLAVFCYDFPHRKSVQFLQRLGLSGLSIVSVLAAPWRKLNIPKSVLHFQKKDQDQLHPRMVSARFGWPYHVVDHNSHECSDIIRSNEVDLAIIAGARILKEPVLSSPRIGIINLHPGWLPEVRGLDTIQWAIYHGFHQGVTAHFIDHHIDRGWLIERREITLQPNDTLLDIGSAIFNLQVEMLLPVVMRALKLKDRRYFRKIGIGNYYSKMSIDLETKIPALLHTRLQEGWRGNSECLSDL